MKRILIICSLAVVLLGCQGIITDTQLGTGKRKWTFIVYMAADNELESSAIADFNEMEGVLLGGQPVSILVLFDRHENYDMTNGNWSDTRLFEVRSDPAGINSTIISPRLNCPELGLTKDTATELNMADPLVLSKVIEFSKRVYPAESYALFIWGHGTGWRGGENVSELPQPLKAVAIDDTSSQYMPLPSLGQAVSGKGLSVIAFDTCFGALLEVAYQIRNDAALFVGSEGVIPSTGWDYTSFFTTFLLHPSLSIQDLGDSIQNQYSAQYGGLSNASISQIDLSRVDNLVAKFNNFAGTVAESLASAAAKDIVLDQVLQQVEGHYIASFPSDLYVDVFDCAQKITTVRTSITSDVSRQTNIAAAAADLEAALTLAIPSSWAKNGTTKKIGVHVISLQGVGVPSSSHELAYIKGSTAIDKSAFVENSPHWVPNVTPRNDNLLDKLFYWIY
ncbi:MAG: hypothetical protein LBI67_06825 [Treponema sp.]|jgi:hypothetical protein|nr:hypothetical protein [Treponema sp.]